MIEISLLRSSEEKSYTTFLKNSNESMFFHSVPYKNLLEEFLSVKSFFLIAKEKEQIIGALPLFLKKNEAYGNIFNSSPFIGSNGGFVIDSHLEDVRSANLADVVDEAVDRVRVEVGRSIVHRRIGGILDVERHIRNQVQRIQRRVALGDVDS